MRNQLVRFKNIVVALKGLVETRMVAVHDSILPCIRTSLKRLFCENIFFLAKGAELFGLKDDEKGWKRIKKINYESTWIRWLSCYGWLSIQAADYGEIIKMHIFLSIYPFNMLSAWCTYKGGAYRCTLTITWCRPYSEVFFWSHIITLRVVPYIYATIHGMRTSISLCFLSLTSPSCMALTQKIMNVSCSHAYAFTGCFNVWPTSWDNHALYVYCVGTMMSTPYLRLRLKKCICKLLRFTGIAVVYNFYYYYDVYSFSRCLCILTVAERRV